MKIRTAWILYFLQPAALASPKPPMPHLSQSSVRRDSPVGSLPGVGFDQAGQTTSILSSF